MLESVLKKNLGADDVGLNEDFRAHDGAVDMGFGGEVNDDINAFHGPVNHFGIADIAFYKLKVQTFEVFQVAGVGQFVENDDFVIRIFAADMTDKVAADEASAAGD